MTEYIIDFNDPRFTIEPIEHNGEIVRCRDCKHYRAHKWFEVVVGTPLGTDISDVCLLWADGCKVEPDGFCAWAIRRDV